MTLLLKSKKGNLPNVASGKGPRQCQSRRACGVTSLRKGLPTSGKVPHAVAAPARGADGECGGERSDGGVSRWLITVGEPEDPLRAPKADPAEEVGHMKVPGPALGALGLPAEENRHRAQRRVARGRVRIADRTLVLAIGAVAAVVVAVFDRAPVLAHRGQELVRRGRARRATGQAEDPRDGGLDRGAFPDVPLDAQELRGAGEVRGERVGGADPNPAPLAATVVFVERLGVGVRGGVLARLRRAGRRGKPPGSWLWARASKLGWLPLARTR